MYFPLQSDCILVCTFLIFCFIWIKLYLNKALRFSGSSVLPAYPGFIVMKIPTEGFKAISSSRKRNLQDKTQKITLNMNYCKNLQLYAKQPTYSSCYEWHLVWSSPVLLPLTELPQ